LRQDAPRRLPPTQGAARAAVNQPANQLKSPRNVVFMQRVEQALAEPSRLAALGGK